MAEQFGVVRRHYQRWTVHFRGKVFDLLLPVEHKIPRVVRRLLDGPRRIVNLFAIGLTGDPVIFDSGIDPDAIGMDEWTDVVHIQVKPNSTVVVAIIRVARVALFAAP